MYYGYLYAYMFYDMVDEFLSFGGIVQNPALIILTLLGPQNYQNNTLTNYLTIGVALLSTVVGLASLLKLVFIQFFINLDNLGYLEFPLMTMTHLKVVFLYWLPEFLYYVFPALGTVAYLISTSDRFLEI